MREITTSKGSVMYLNSGDWIENLTSLEYNNGAWKLYHYMEDVTVINEDENIMEPMEILNKNQLFQNLVQEFQITKTKDQWDRLKLVVL